MTATKTKSVSHATFTLERTFTASPARVFRAWTDPAAYHRWFVSGEGWAIAEYTQDFRVGGHEHGRFSQTKAGAPFTNETHYLDIVPETRIIFTYAMGMNGKAFSHSLATFEFHAEGQGTRLVYTEQAAFLDGADGVAMRKAGWTELLGKLEAELATH